MKVAMWRRVVLLFPIIFKTAVSVHTIDAENKLSLHSMRDISEDIGPYVTTVSDEEYIRRIHSMINAYQSDGNMGGRLVIETNAHINTKYRTLKRNADLINSLLALPKGMNDAGR